MDPHMQANMILYVHTHAHVRAYTHTHTHKDEGNLQASHYLQNSENRLKWQVVIQLTNCDK